MLFQWLVPLLLFYKREKQNHASLGGGGGGGGRKAGRVCGRGPLPHSHPLPVLLPGPLRPEAPSPQLPAAKGSGWESCFVLSLAAGWQARWQNQEVSCSRDGVHFPEFSVLGDWWHRVRDGLSGGGAQWVSSVLLGGHPGGGGAVDSRTYFSGPSRAVRTPPRPLPLEVSGAASVSYPPLCLI